ncbi:hypothetical protein [Ottowia testudinis]|uniref:Uncharacterized protein n=1 Tax=Ottowia testudinis TaxID=2816950 RepID=A0A975CI21_9BURK|nr:hypothetical protein [Ottowia testudinis]QTD45969.1 hypothetical protein J1M35_03375 [Ottowia testudinis]
MAMDEVSEREAGGNQFLLHATVFPDFVAIGLTARWENSKQRKRAQKRQPGDAPKAAAWITSWGKGARPLESGLNPQV